MLDNKACDFFTENVVDCIWRGTDPQPKCQVSRGFQTPELKGSEVRILLQKASSSNVGEYSCTAGDSFPPNSKRCLFSLLQPGKINSLSFFLSLSPTHTYAKIYSCTHICTYSFLIIFNLHIPPYLLFQALPQSHHPLRRSRR